MAADLGTAIDALVACVCDALEDAGRAACACGQTIGPPAIGPAECCECGDDTGGQLSATLERMYPVDGQTLQRVVRLENCRPGAVAADVTLVLSRCYPTIDEQGAMPSLDDVSPYVDGLYDDVQIIWRALQCCVSEKLVIRDLAVDASPSGGCSAIAVRVTVAVTPKPPAPIGS